MESALVWIKTAEEHLRFAESNLSVGNCPLAYQEAIWCGETLLKAVLVRNKIFSRSDQHHNIIKLFEKIENAASIDPAVLVQAENIIMSEGFGYIDVTSGGGSHMDCLTTQAPRIRYPIDGSLPSELFSYNDAHDKIAQASRLLKLLLPFI